MSTLSRGRQFLSDALTVAMLLAAVAVAVGAVRNSFFRPATVDTGAVTTLVPLGQWNHMLAKAHVASGDSSQRPTLLIFTDYQCPFCGRLERVLDSLQHTAHGGVQVAYRHFPLSQHPYARTAAKAAICVEASGGFPRLHRALFARQDSLGLVPWSALADAAGVHTDSLAACMAQGETEAIIAADLDAGRRLRLAGTPTLYIDGRLFAGHVTLAALDSAVAYARAHPRVASE